LGIINQFMSNQLVCSFVEASFFRFISSISIRSNYIIELSIKKKFSFKINHYLNLDPILNFHGLLDIWVVDYPQELNRFQVNYLLVSYIIPARLRLITYTSEINQVSSITSLFKSANWLEREAYDFFGVFFSEHPDLRRILTDYGFEGYPMRKDFPLSGYFEVRYDDESKKVVHESLRLSQEFRYFDFLTPWEND